jgi:two-component system sensor histidine kinase RpfC
LTILNLSSLQQVMASCQRFPASLRQSFVSRTAEFEQAIVRLAIGALVLVYVLFFPLEGMHSVASSLLATVFFLISFSLLLQIILYPGDFHWRKCTGVVNDIFFITASIHIAGQNGQPIYLMYLWVIFGNGFRFGRAYLNFALSLSLLGFSTALVAVPHWQEHTYQGLSMLASLALLSAYFGTLLNRLTEALKAQEAANQAKRRFISSVSHELRTPLNAIIGITDLLQTSKVSPDQREMLSTLNSSSKLMHALINDVLDFSKIEANKILIDEAPFDVRELVYTSTAMFRQQASARGIALEVAVADDIPELLIGDVHHLRQVLINLLSNAVKFTERGTVSVRIGNSGQKEEGVHLLFEVEDTGIGIDPVAQTTIFDSFTQASPSIGQKFGGTGLGTAIAQQLVQLMGGEIRLRSKLGVGSVFYFTLRFQSGPPAAAAEICGAPGAAPAESNEEPGTWGTGMPSFRVLVADDNPVNRSVLQRVLERAGHHCTVVNNGEEALDWLEKEPFDAVVLDLHMPVLDGLEALRAYHFLTIPEERIPVIMFSADASVETEAECLQAGVDAFLSKPIDVEKFVQTLETLATRRPPAGSGAAMRPAYSPVILSQPDQEDALDYSILSMLESIGQSATFVDSLIDSFCTDSELNIRRLGNFLQAGDVQQFNGITHAIKGSAAGIGAASLDKCCTSYQNIAENNFARQGPAALQAIRAQYGVTSRALAVYKRHRAQEAKLQG